MHDSPDDGFEHRLPVARHNTVPEAQDAEILCLQKSCALLIVIGALEMLAAVQFNDQSALETCEVGDVRTYRDLPSKACAWNFSAAQLLPQSPFRLGHCISECASKLLSSRF